MLAGHELRIAAHQIAARVVELDREAGGPRFLDVVTERQPLQPPELGPATLGPFERPLVAPASKMTRVVPPRSSTASGGSSWTSGVCAPTWCWAAPARLARAREGGAGQRALHLHALEHCDHVAAGHLVAGRDGVETTTPGARLRTKPPSSRGRCRTPSTSTSSCAPWTEITARWERPRWTMRRS